MNFIKGDINWGIIGCGDVCEVKSGPAFGKVDNSHLKAVMRRNGKKAKEFAQRHHIPRFYDDADALIHDKEVNAVYIATPPAFHEEYATEAMAAGKAVYVEKPLALDAAGCERMIEAAKKYDVPASGAYYRRALPLFLKVRSLIEENAVGKIRIVDLKMLQSQEKNIIADSEENWRVNPALSGGGLFHDLAPHQLDIFTWIFGPPERVSGSSLNQARAYNAPDLTNLTAEFKDDIFFTGLWSFHVPPGAVEDTCRVIGDKGMFSFSFFGNPLIKIYIGGSEEFFEFEHPPHIQWPMIEKAVKYMRGEEPNPCSFEDALVSMKMMDQTK